MAFYLKLEIEPVGKSDAEMNSVWMQMCSMNSFQRLHDKMNYILIKVIHVYQFP